MLDRFNFWWRTLSQGAGSLNSAAGWLSLIVLALGVAAGVTVPLVFHVSHWLTAVIVMAAVVIVVLEGSYRVWAVTDAERKTALESARAKSAVSVHGPTFWDVKGGAVTGNVITNTHNAAKEGEGWNSRLIAVESGASISESEVNVEFGNGRSPGLPELFPSSPDERVRLRDQLLILADEVDAVMAAWGQTRQAVAAQMGIAPDEFMARMPEILSERSKIDAEVTMRYNRECRSAVIQIYGHARSIGFAYAEMEGLWQTRLGVGGSRIPALLRRIATGMPD